MKKLIIVLAAAVLFGCGKDKVYPPPADTTGPKVVTTSPADGDSNVALDAPLTVTFDEDIDPLSITWSSFYLNAGLNGTVTYDNKTATLTPDSAFQYGETYTATVTTAVTDVAGNHMDSNYVWSFTATLGEIMPLAIGNWWAFQIIDFRNPVVPDTSYDTIRVVSDTSIQGEQWYILDDSSLLTNRDHGLWRMAETGTPYLWLKFPGVIGQTYNADPVSGQSVEITDTARFIAIPTLPFFYCYGYLMTYADTSLGDRLYFAPRFGPVKLQYDTVYVFTKPLETWTLIGLKLN